jgi:hypothetical protein
MAQWGNTDDAANSVLWAVSQFNKVANTDNQTNLFGNTTADAFVTGITVGQYGEDVNEAQAKRQDATARPAHAGWVLKKTGSGNRAGRVSYETLVAFGSMSGDDEDTTFPDYEIVISTQPLANTANTTAGQNATFRVVAATVPTGGTLTYSWTYANGSAIQAGANVGVKTAANLVVNSAVETANVSYKVTISATGADSVTSSNATLTITT